MRIYKFDGNATASVRGMQHVAKLIQDNTSKIVVLSAPKDVTKHLGEVAASFFNRNIEEAHGGTYLKPDNGADVRMPPV